MREKVGIRRLLQIVDRHTLLIYAALLALGGVLLLGHQANLHSQLVETTATEHAKALSAALTAFRALYTSEVVDVARKHGVEVTHNYRQKPGSLPLPVTLSMQLSQWIGEHGSGMKSRLYSPYPFPTRGETGGLTDTFAEEAWQALNAASHVPFARKEMVDGHWSLRYATADIMRPLCVECHNTHADSPKRDWKAGDVRGVLEVVLPLDALAAQSSAGLRGAIVLFAAFGLVVLGSLALIVGRMRRSTAQLEQRVHERTLELDKERHLLHTLMNNVPDNVYFKDASSRFLMISRAQAQRFGLDDAASAIGKTDADFFSAEHAGQALEDERELMRSGRPVIAKEEKETWTDGRVTWVATTKLPLGDRDGRIVGTFGLSRDITEQVSAREALREAKEAAEAANRAKSEFLANMSHEIRTPLNAVIGLTELVLDTELSRTQREYLTMVQESSESLLSVINDILDFSKIEAGKLDLDKAAFDIREVVGDTMKSLAIRADRKGLELVCQVARDVPDAVFGDAGRLRQIIVNLVGNAIKFTEKGEVLLRIESQSGAEPSSGAVALQFSVADTGIGIGKDKLAKVFRPFEQEDTSTTRRFGGTGLGLAIAMRLVDLMGGRIWAESEPGKGSTFYFTAQFGLAERAATWGADTLKLQGLRVLVVDDNATNRHILVEMLSNWGLVPAAVSSCSDALQALEAARRFGQSFALVLTDCNMPEADGFDLAQKIVGNPDFRHSIVMMLTSGGRPDDIRRCEELGIAAYLMKPIKQSELFNAIAGVIGLPAIGEPAPDAASGESAQSVRRLQILLAEDSVVNQTVAMRLLEKMGHVVTLARTGKEALDAVATRTFDLVLMDVQMPEMDGFEATTAIRNQERQSGGHLPVIAMTAHAMKGDRERCLEAGMDDYIAKPIRPRALAEVIGRRFPEFASDGQPVDRAPAMLDIDWTAAFSRVGGKQEILLRIAPVVLQEFPRLLDELRDAVAHNDGARVQLAAHTFKGSVEYFPSQSTFDAAWRLEQMGRARDLTGASDTLATLEAESRKLIAAIEEFTAAGTA